MFAVEVDHDPGHHGVLGQVICRAAGVSIDEAQIFEVAEFSLPPFLSESFFVELFLTVDNEIYFLFCFQLIEKTQKGLPIKEVKEVAFMCPLTKEFKCCMPQNISARKDLASSKRNLCMTYFIDLPFAQGLPPVASIG